MKRLVAPLVLAAFFQSPAVSQTMLSGTPASIEMENVCPHTGGEGECRQAAADMAQRYCQKQGRNAQYVRAAPMQRQFSGVKWWFLYNCVR